jgi:GT2 family glycosyltransferase
MFVFIILHYKSLKETLECVQSIYHNVQTANKVIIIVDNHSPNGSGEALAKTYQESSEVIVLLNEQNLGYAKGLNTGISYAKAHYDYDFMVLMNNDTEICGRNWENTITNKFNEYSFHVLGPDVVALDHSHSNPMNQKIRGIRDLLKQMCGLIIDILISFFYLDNIADKSKAFVKRLIGYQVTDERAVDQDCFHVQLHGSCIILSKLFFEKYEGLFSDTFLYYEEDILSYMAQRDGLLIMYTPQIVLLHKEGVATRCDTATRRRKELFSNMHSFKSCMIFLQLIRKDRKQAHLKEKTK